MFQDILKSLLYGIWNLWKSLSYHTEHVYVKVSTYHWGAN